MRFETKSVEKYIIPICVSRFKADLHCLKKHNILLSLPKSRFHRIQKSRKSFSANVLILVAILSHLRRIMRKPDFAYAKTKAQISCAVTFKWLSSNQNQRNSIQSISLSAHAVMLRRCYGYFSKFLFSQQRKY